VPLVGCPLWARCRGAAAVQPRGILVVGSLGDDRIQTGCYYFMRYRARRYGIPDVLRGKDRKRLLSLSVRCRQFRVKIEGNIACLHCRTGLDVRTRAGEGFPPRGSIGVSRESFPIRPSDDRTIGVYMNILQSVKHRRVYPFKLPWAGGWR